MSFENMDKTQDVPVSQETIPKVELSQEELDAKYSVEKKEPSPLASLKACTDPSEFSSVLNRLDTITDPIAGEITIRQSLKDSVDKMNLDLGEAVALIRQNRKFEGTPERIVGEVYAKITELPGSLQNIYRNMAGEYINKAIANTSAK